MKIHGKFLTILPALLILAAFVPVCSFAEDVEVFVEGAYTDTTLDVYLYADITGPNLCSFGVKLTYSSPLTVTNAEKNEAVWFLGSETYMDPEINPGDIVVIGGKLDPSSPLDGVGGTRTLLGVVSFSHSDPSADFASLLGITYGRGDGTGDYKNFVATDGTVMDGTSVNFGAISVYERGDANEDGVLTNSDMFKVRQMLIDNEYRVYADCNDDGVMTNSDMFCIRGKL
jgi:hypothetical protein